MMLKILHLLSLTFLTHLITCQTNTTISSYLPCTSKYTPYYNGTCMPSANCMGATLTEICPSKAHVCCIPDPDVSLVYPENQFITLQRYLKFLGDTPRNRLLYNLFSRSMTEAQITTCHQAAAYFAQMRGESKNLGYFEETIDPAFDLDFDTSIGNNERGDGVKYRGRGALLLRGKGVYVNATLGVPITKYNLFAEPEAAAFPSVAFRVAAWIWNKNAFVITTNAPAKRGSLNAITDGTFHNFTLITHVFTQNLQQLKDRAQYYEDAVNELKCNKIKRGRGVNCEINENIGYAVPICLIGFKKPYCGCEGQYIKNSCPYGSNSPGHCRNPIVVSCCYEKCDAPLDLVVVMDSSGSIGAADFQKGLNFIKLIVNDLVIGENDTRVGIINYSTDAEIVTKLNSVYNKTSLLQIISNMPYQNGWTNTQAGLATANDVLLQEVNGMRSLDKGVPKVVIVITDGESNIQPELTIPNAQKIKERDISIIAVGVGPAINPIELEAISSNKDEVFNVDNYDKISVIIESLIKTTCEQPARVTFEEPIEGKVSLGSYRYFKLSLSNQTDDSDELNDFSIGLSNLKGSTKLFYSFDDETPKDPADFVEDNDTDISYGFIEQRKRRNSKVKETFYSLSKPSDKDILYMSVKGLDEENEFQIYVYNRTIEVESTTIESTTTTTEATTTIRKEESTISQTLPSSFTTTTTIRSTSVTSSGKILISIPNKLLIASVLLISIIL